MAEFKYTVEGIYETDKGSGKDYTPFKFEIRLPRFEGHEKGAGTHILRRFLPILIRNLKNKPVFTKVRNWVITNIEKLNDAFPLEGTDINNMNEKEIQELACMYDLYEIPLPATTSVDELREFAQKAYMKNVLKIKMNTVEEQERLEFFKRQPDGSLKFDLGNEVLTVQVIDVYKNDKTVVKKKKLADFISTDEKQQDDNVLDENGAPNVPQGNGLFPSNTELENGTPNVPQNNR